jgi:3-oxoacyl-[acyl-carrier protein] reductase
MKLNGKIALITGAGSGMGRASALLFSDEGAKVSVVDINAENGQDTSRQIKEQGKESIFIQADVSKENDVKEMIRGTVDAYGKIDILFNNAGIPMAFTSLEEVTVDQWDRIMDVNAKGVFMACKYGFPIMKKQGGGVIINTASISGIRPRPGLSPYAASKGAVITLTKELAVELAPYKIRVNCINPVSAETPMLNEFLGNKNLEEGRKAVISTIPLGRMAQPEDIAYAALYLASDDSSMVTGDCINIDGGRGI